MTGTIGLCPECMEPVPAEVFERGDEVFLRKECPRHGVGEVKISSDAGWYHRVMAFPAHLTKPPVRKTFRDKGCPMDCGFCDEHSQRMVLPVVPVTSACNLDCPVCYTINKNKNAYFMSEEEFGLILQRMNESAPGRGIINFTGGEPLSHPNFPRLVEMSREAGIGRITISTNGMAFLKDEGLLERLTELDARIVFSFNSFRPEPYRVTAGKDLLEQKLAILELLEKYKPSTTLLSVVGRGLNENEIGDIVTFVLEKDFIISSEIHTVTFTGQNVDRFDRGKRLTVPCVLKGIAASNSQIRMEDFLPSPNAHPLCYATCYLIKTAEGEYVPFPSFMDEERIKQMMSENLYIEPSARTEAALTEVINHLWSREQPGQWDDRVLESLQGLLRRLSDTPGVFSRRQKEAERVIKAIYIHSHMDADNFDVNRIKQCCVAVPDSSGHCIPTCAYNIIYRARDPRFCQHAAGPDYTTPGLPRD